MEKNSLYETVKHVMQKYPDTVHNEFSLYLKVCESLKVKTGKSLRKLLTKPEKYGAPLLSTVIRHRYQVIKDGLNAGTNSGKD